MPFHSLQFQQIDFKIKRFESIKKSTMPSIGWIRSIRMALGMSMLQLGNKLEISKQAVYDMEKREKDGSITIKSLREVASAMDMELVYGFVPNAGSLEALVEKRARELATEIVMKAAHNMKLENQSNSKQRIDKAIRERTESIVKEMPKFLWD